MMIQSRMYDYNSRSPGYRSMKTFCLTLVAITLLTGSACRRPSAPVAPNVALSPTPTVGPAATPAPSPRTSEVEPVLGTEPIEFEGYRLTREVKTVKDVASGRDTETEYGVLKYGAKTVMFFDADAFGTGNHIAFGLYPFLGAEHKQLFVERTGNREWEQWIVELSPHFRVIYHSTDYGFWGRLGVEDIDHDGVYELSTRVTRYYMFADLPHGGSAEVVAILKYDQGAKKYVPANYLFQDEALKGNEEALASLPSKSGIDYRQQLLNIFFAYLYAGKEREAWDFFEKEYNKPDKADLERKIRRELALEPVFQYLHPHRSS